MKTIMVLICALFLAACGASDRTRSSRAYNPQPTSGSQYQNAVYTGDADDEGESVGSVTSDGPTSDKKVEASEVRPNGAKTNQKTQTTTPKEDVKKEPPTAEELEKRLVKNAYMRLTVKKEKEIPGRIEQVETIAKGVNGYVSQKTEMSIIARVPNDSLDMVLKQVRDLGKVADENVSVVDVTAQYVDLQLRIDNLRKLKTRLQELVAQGQNVKEILEVEKELGRITQQLESLEGQMRVMRNQTTYATVSVSFKKRVRPGPIGWVFYGIYSGVKWLFVWD